MTRGGGTRDQRRDARLPVGQRAALLVYRHRHDVLLVDLSNSGAMVSGEAGLPAQGDEVVLAFDGFEAVATIVWVKGGNAGLALHRAIDARAVVRRLRDAERGRRTPEA